MPTGRLIGMSDAAVENDDSERALKLMADASAMIESIPQPSVKADASTELVPRLFKINEPQKARNAVHSALTAIAGIRDDSRRAKCLPSDLVLDKRWQGIRNSAPAFL